MTTASLVQGYVEDIQEALGTMPETAKNALNSLGLSYIYEAWVLTQFAARDRTGDWSWHHPSPSGAPRFPAGAGGTLQSALARSHLEDEQSEYLAVQGVTVWGRSSAKHKMDIVILDWDARYRYERYRDARYRYPLPEDVVAAIECKHYTKSVGLDIARDAGGLSADLGGAAVRVVTSGSLTSPALSYFNGDAQWLQRRVHCPWCGDLHARAGLDRDRRLIKVMGDDDVRPNGEQLPQRW